MARYQRHNERALLTVLSEKPFAKVGVADVSREAGISRSTFYAHFAGVHEVFEACVADFLASARPLGAQLRCSSCKGEAPGRPFCECLRDAGAYGPLVRDPHFLVAALELLFRSADGNGVVGDYVGMGLDADQARIIALFQMSGCYAAALAEPSGADWEKSQSAIDDFIRGGVSAVRSSSQPHPNE